MRIILPAPRHTNARLSAAKTASITTHTGRPLLMEVLVAFTAVSSSAPLHRTRTKEVCSLYQGIESSGNGKILTSGDHPGVITTVEERPFQGRVQRPTIF